MFPNPNNPLSITKVISGISKTLNIANQVLPLYNQVTPMIGNAKKAFSFIKDINFKISPKISKTITNENKAKKITTYSGNNGPTFFK